MIGFFTVLYPMAMILLTFLLPPAYTYSYPSKLAASFTAVDIHIERFLHYDYMHYYTFIGSYIIYII